MDAQPGGHWGCAFRKGWWPCPALLHDTRMLRYDGEEDQEARPVHDITTMNTVDLACSNDVMGFFSVFVQITHQINAASEVSTIPPFAS